jgi:hypothetical protein
MPTDAALVAVQVQLMTDAIAEIARIAADARIPDDRIKVFAIQERLRQLSVALGKLRGEV